MYVLNEHCCYEGMFPLKKLLRILSRCQSVSYQEMDFYFIGGRGVQCGF